MDFYSKVKPSSTCDIVDVRNILRRRMQADGHAMTDAGMSTLQFSKLCGKLAKRYGSANPLDGRSHRHPQP